MGYSNSQIYKPFPKIGYVRGGGYNSPFPYEPELYAYLGLPDVGLTKAQADAINANLVEIKYGSGISLSSVVLNLSNVTGAYFVTNPVFTATGLPPNDLRWLVGFKLTLSDGSKTLAATVVGVGNIAGETYGTTGGPLNDGEMVEDPSFDNASKWTAQTGWTINGNGQASTTSQVASWSGYQNNASYPFVVGALYKGQIVISAISSGTFRIRTFGVDDDMFPTHAIVGTFNDYRTFIGAETYRAVTSAIGTVGTVESISMRKVITSSLYGITLGTPVVEAGFNPNEASFTATIARP